MAEQPDDGCGGGINNENQPPFVEAGMKVSFYDLSLENEGEEGHVVSVLSSGIADISIDSDSRIEADVPVAYFNCKPERGYSLVDPIVFGGEL